MIFSFEDYLFEVENLKMKKELREYTLSEISNGTFKLKSNDIEKQFNVLPYKKEIILKLKDIYENMLEALDSLNAANMFSKIEKAERLDYKYGNIFNTKFNLEEISGISFTQEQIRDIKDSPHRFLLNEFSRVSKDTQVLITGFLKERLEILCVVIQALFFYIRKTDKENFYNGLNSQEIVEEYEKNMEIASEDFSFSYDGPFSDYECLNHLSSKDLYAYWKCSSHEKSFILKGTVSPNKIYDEDTIGGIKNFKLSICDNKSKNIEGFSYFDSANLSSMIKKFLKIK